MTENTTPIDSEEVSQILVNMVIPPCPKIVLALVQEAHAEEPDIGKLDKLLSGDVGLASAILKTANSPYYGLSRKAQAVKQAILVLGIRMVTNIVTMLALQKALAVPAASLDRFWDRTNYHAIACGRLARYLRSVSADGAFTFGLFNDCGIPILVQRFPDYKETLRIANSSADRSFVDIEHERHHTSHALVGAILARSWQLPEIVCKAIRDHHALELLYDSSEAHGDVPALCAISLIADYLVNDFLHVRQEAEWEQHGTQAMTYLGFGVEELAEIKIDITDELEEARIYRQ